MPIYQIPDELIFPPITHAEPNGMLGVGGDLSPSRLLLAYKSGIFPWFSEEEPILWWSPNPRFVLFPHKIKVSKSMKQLFRKEAFTVSFDQDFVDVIANCQQIHRPGQRGTWITEEMKLAYIELHKWGFAHSVEVKLKGELVGGLYGVSLGNCFFGESMFAKTSNASKYGFITLVQKLEKKGFALIDCQMHTSHLESLGAEMIAREKFQSYLDLAVKSPNLRGDWQRQLNN